MLKKLFAIILSTVLIFTLITGMSLINIYASVSPVSYGSGSYRDLLYSSDLSAISHIGFTKTYGGSTLRADVTNCGGCLTSSVIDTDDISTFYGQGSMYYNASAYEPNSAYHYPSVILANITKGATSGYLALRFPGKGSTAQLSILNSSGISVLDLCALSGVSTVQKTTHTFKYGIDILNGLLTVEIDDTIILTDYDLNSVNGIEVNSYNVGAAQYYASFQLSNYVVFSDYVKPVFNSETQTKIYENSNTGNLSNTAFTTYDYSDSLIDSSKPVFTSLSVNTVHKPGGYYSVFVALADAVKKSDGSECYLGFRFTLGKGWLLAITSKSGDGTTGDVMAGKAWVNYPSNSGTSMPSGGVTVTSVVENGKVSVWLDGVIQTYEFQPSDYTIISPVLGGSCFLNDGNYYYFSDVSVWTAKTNVKSGPSVDTGLEINLTPYSKVISNLSETFMGDSYKFSQKTSGTGCYVSYFKNLYIKDTTTLYLHAVIEDDVKSSVSNSTLEYYSGPAIILGKVVYDSNGKEGYLTLRFTKSDGIDFRISELTGEDVVYLGAITGMKFNYPDTLSAQRGENGYTVDVQISKQIISVYVNDSKIVNKVNFSSFGSTPKSVTVNSIIPGLMMAHTLGTVSQFRFGCDKEELNDLYMVDLTKSGNLSIASYGNVDFVDSSFNFGSSNYSYYDMNNFSAVDETEYFSGIISAQTKGSFDGEYIAFDIARIRKGVNSGRLILAMTPENGIDLRMVDQDGSTVMSTTDLGLPKSSFSYPQSNSKIWDDARDSSITIQIVPYGLSVIIDGTAIIKDLSFAKYSISLESICFGASAKGEHSGALVSDVRIQTVPDEYAQLGDLNGDGKINVIDMVRGKLILLGIKQPFNSRVADFHNNCRMEEGDLNVLRKSLLNICETPAKDSISLGNVFVLGDSYSTYNGWNNNNTNAYYGSGGARDIWDVNQTWWKRLINETDSTLLMNDSVSGTTICNTGYGGADATSVSFIGRLDQWISNGYFSQNHIDTFIIFGGTNDSWANSPIGELKYSDWSTEDKKSVLPAYCYLLNRLKQVCPDARIICMINNGLKDEITQGLSEANQHNNIETVLLEDIEKITSHPTYNGMRQITRQLIRGLSKD